MNSNWMAFEKFIDPNTYTGALLLAVVIFIIAWIACAVTTHLIRRANLVMGKLRRKVDETVAGYVIRIKNLLIFLTAVVLYASLVPSLRALVGTMVAGAGITALVVGFAAKSTLANLIAGLSLAVYRPVRIGDKVNIEGEYGTVEDITLRHTIVRTWQGKRLVIPNAKLDEMTLTNFSIIDPRIKCTIEMGVSYDTDIDLAKRFIFEEAGLCPYRDPAGEEAPYVRVISHGDFSIGLRLYVWVKDADDSYSARFWLLEHIKKRFDREGIEIPFPYRTLVYKKDLPAPRKEETIPVEDENV
jgi:small-conductance mechanosensitive channel